MTFVPISKLLGHFLNRKNLSGIALASHITELWPQIAANIFQAPLNKEIVAVSYKKGRLLLRVPSSIAAQEAQFKRLEIIAAFKELLEKSVIDDIRFRVVSSIEDDYKNTKPSSRRLRWRSK